MLPVQEQYDEAMFEFSTGNFDLAISKLQALLGQDPHHFDAQLSLGMAYCRIGDYGTAIVEGHKAERLNPTEQLAHTNLSLFYLKAGDKSKAEFHGLQARIASWRSDPGSGARPADDPSLAMAKSVTPSGAPPTLPAMPWKKKIQEPSEPGEGSKAH